MSDSSTEMAMEAGEDVRDDDSDKDNNSRLSPPLHQEAAVATPISALCTQMAAFSYDRAKEMAEKERDAYKASSSGLSCLMNFMSQLVHMEKQYVHLSFLCYPKSIFRKENSLKTSYIHMSTELRKLQEGVGNKLNHWVDEEKHNSVSKMAINLESFVAARLEMLEFYENLSTLGLKMVESTAASAKDSKDSNTIDWGRIKRVGLSFENILISHLEVIEKKCNKTLKSVCMGNLSLSFNWELTALFSSIKALSLINLGKSLEAMIELTQAKRSLDEWDAFRQENKQEATMHKSLFESFFKSSGTAALTGSLRGSEYGGGGPRLFQWLYKLKDVILSKYTLYFYELFLSHTTPETLSQCYNNFSAMDHIKRIAEFQEKYQADMVTLVVNDDINDDATSFGRNDDDSYSQDNPSVQVRKLSQGPWSGIHQVIFTSNLVRDGDKVAKVVVGTDKALVAKHLAIISKNISDQGRSDMLLPDDVIHFCENKLGTGRMYSVMRIDQLVTMIVIFEGKRVQSAQVASFLLEMAQQLRCGGIFTQLKDGNKK